GNSDRSLHGQNAKFLFRHTQGDLGFFLFGHIKANSGHPKRRSRLISSHLANAIDPAYSAGRKDDAIGKLMRCRIEQMLWERGLNLTLVVRLIACDRAGQSTIKLASRVS